MNAKSVMLGLLAAVVFLSANSEELLRTTGTWEGGDIVYPQGNAEISSFIVKFEEGEATPFHCHPVPTIGYVLKGKLEVETKSGKKTIVSEGQSLVEVSPTVHRGTVIAGPVEIVVFYVGAESIPNVCCQRTTQSPSIAVMGTQGKTLPTGLVITRQINLPGAYYADKAVYSSHDRRICICVSL